MILQSVRNLTRRVRNMIARGVVKAVIDAGGLQVVSVELLKDEVKDGVERFQQYGFTGHPLPGAEALAASLQGLRDHTVVFVIDDRRHRYKPTDPGDVAMYDYEGQKAHLTREGLVIEAKNIILRTEGTLRLEGEAVEIHARKFLQTEVHGHGERKTYIGGKAYHSETFTEGAVTDGEEKGLNQPALPSTHPEADTEQ